MNRKPVPANNSPPSGDFAVLLASTPPGLPTGPPAASRAHLPLSPAELCGLRAAMRQGLHAGAIPADTLELLRARGYVEIWRARYELTDAGRRAASAAPDPQGALRG